MKTYIKALSIIWFIFTPVWIGIADTRGAAAHDETEASSEDAAAEEENLFGIKGMPYGRNVYGEPGGGNTPGDAENT